MQKTSLIVVSDNYEDAAHARAVLEAVGYEVTTANMLPGGSPTRAACTARELASIVANLSHKHKLSSRQRDVLEALLNGCNLDEIACRLNVKRETVKWHKHNVFAKLCVSSAEDLVRYAFGLPRRGSST